MFEKQKIALFMGDFDSLYIDEKEVVDIDHIFVGLDVEACHFAVGKNKIITINRGNTRYVTTKNN